MGIAHDQEHWHAYDDDHGEQAEVVYIGDQLGLLIDRAVDGSQPRRALQIPHWRKFEMAHSVIEVRHLFTQHGVVGLCLAREVAGKQRNA